MRSKDHVQGPYMFALKDQEWLSSGHICEWVAKETLERACLIYQR